MKKKIALFANGWGNEYLLQIVKGMKGELAKQGADLYCFVDFSVWADSYINNEGEYNIFTLPNLKDFDGAVYLENSFNMKEEFAFAHEVIEKAGIPVVGIESTSQAVSTIHSDDYIGMFELTEHLIKKHGVKNVVYIGGPEEYYDNQVRLKAVKYALEKYGLKLLQENIFFADWAKNVSKRFVQEWIQTKHSVPDAFICANDIMATGVCEALKEYHYEIPRDVIVTGFDCTKQGITYDPPISSVTQEWISSGKEAARLLILQMSGDTTIRHRKMKTAFVPACTCGCYETGPEFYKAVDISKLITFSDVESLQADSHFRHFYNTTKKAEDEDSLHASYSSLFQAEHWLEGENLAIFLDKEFFHIVEEDTNLSSLGYPEQMELVCGLKDGQIRKLQTLSKKDALFLMAEESPNPQVFIVSPHYSEEKAYGFSILARDIELIQDNYLYIWTRHMNQSFEQARRNVMIADLTRRLTLLSTMDSLTGTYNRTGCGDVIFPKMEELHKEGKTLAVLVADIDRMKTINDDYGHGSGDIALKLVAKAILDVIPTDWMVSRFGGDEFMIVGPIEEESFAAGLVEEVIQRLGLLSTMEKVRFPLSVSIGFDLISATGKDLDLGRHLQVADDKMYLLKKEHHAIFDKK